jgi:flagellar assembly factor FliW
VQLNQGIIGFLHKTKAMLMDLQGMFSIKINQSTQAGE